MTKSGIRFPKEGLSKDQLLEKMNSRRTKDAKWQDGKAFALVYHPGKERAESIREAYNLFFSENALNPTAFPSLRNFEAEVVAMTADLFHGSKETCGSLTSGGTESILMAVKTARSWAEKYHPEVKEPEILIPSSAHPAFWKACYYFKVKGVKAPLGEDFRLDVDWVREYMESEKGKNVILLVGSSPSYPHGVIDPIEQLSDLALKHKRLLHVDACVGGFILPFASKLGWPIPIWDFTLEGVTSISADVHKYGYAAKGASLIMYRNHELRKHQFFVYTDWIGGVYGSPTMLGTRPGGAIAAAWAALNSIGEKGYLEMAERTLEATKLIRAGIESMEAIKLIGEPDVSLLAFGSDTLDVHSLADELSIRGWHFDRQQDPDSIHLTISQVHLDIVDEFLADLGEAVIAVQKFRLGQVGAAIKVKAVQGLQSLLPDGVLAKVDNALSGTKGFSKKRKAAMYGMMGALAGTGDLNQMVVNFLDKLNSLDLSSEGG